MHAKRSILAILVVLGAPSAVHASTAYFRNFGGPAPAITTFDFAMCRMTGENIALTGYRVDPIMPPGAQPMLLARADDAGVPVWIQGVDTPGADFGHSVIETANTDLATAGYTMDIATGLFDMLLTRFTRAGAPVYVRTVVGPGNEYAFSHAEDPTDGGLVVTGWSDSFTPGFALALFKMTPAGAMAWGFVYGGALPAPALSDRGTHVTRLFDGGWAVTGWSQSLAAGGATQDLLLMRVTAAGAIAWVRTLGYGAAGGPTVSEGRSVVETPDGGLVVVGQTGNAAVATRDMLVAKFTPGGALMWAERVGGPAEDFAHSVTLTDDGFAVAGYSVQPGLAEQAIVVGFDGLGTPLWNRAIGLGGFEEFRSVTLAGDGRLFVAGRTAAFGPGVINITYGAVDPTGAGCLGGGVPLLVASPLATVTIQPIASAVFPAVIGPTPAAIAALPTTPAPICSQPSVLVPYVNTYSDAVATGMRSSAIAQGLGTAGVVTGSITLGGTLNWGVMRFDPLGGVRWAKSYATNPGTSVEWGRGIARTLQGWWSVGLTQASPANPRFPLVMKIDDTGVITLQRRIAGVESDPYGLVATTDGGVAVVGHTVPGPGNPMRVFVTKLSSAAAHQWTTTLSAANHVTQGFAIRQVADGGYVIAGMDQDIAGGFPALLIAKLNGAGALLWARALQLGGGHLDVARAVTETAAGNYAVAGSDIDNNTGDETALIAEFNPAGALQWLTRMQSPDVNRVTGLFPRGDSLVVCGVGVEYSLAGQQLTFAKTNAAGDVVWLRALFEPGMANGDAVTVSDGGEIVIAGTSFFGGPGTHLLGKFNARGNACLGVGYEPSFSHPADAFYDPGLSGTGEARTMAISTLIDTDETFAMTNCPAPLVGVSEPPWPSRMHGALEFAIVSPASGTLECRITAAQTMTLRLTLFDLTGRRVGSFRIGELLAGPHVVHLPMAGRARGMYTAVVDGGSVSAQSKFIFLGD